jgi:hypothetical protein
MTQALSLDTSLTPRVSTASSYSTSKGTSRYSPLRINKARSRHTSTLV